jgi:hypothetical protein
MEGKGQFMAERVQVCVFVNECSYVFMHVCSTGLYSWCLSCSTRTECESGDHSVPRR